MIARTQTREVASQPPLEDRIAAFRRELDGFVLARALEIEQSSPGVPLETIMVMLNRGSGCQCAVAEQIVATRKKDAEIASRQESK